MCEAMLEYRGSSQQAMVCIKKAAKYNAGYPDWRIFMSRILLENSVSVTTDEPILTSIPVNERFENLDPVDVLAETLQVK